jgi:hypothetical protein
MASQTGGLIGAKTMVRNSRDSKLESSNQMVIEIASQFVIVLCDEAATLPANDLVISG